MATVAKGKRRTVAETKSYFAHRKRSLWYIYQTIPGTGAAIIVNREGAPTARKAWARLIGEAASVAISEPERIRFTVGESDDLLTRRPEATLEGPKPLRSGKVGRDRAKPDTSTYEGRFAARLGDLTKAAGFEPPALAQRLGVSEQVVYDWLAGRKMPAVGRFPVLAKLFKLKHPGDILPPK